MSPIRKFKFAYGIVFFIGVFNIVAGLVVLLFRIEILLKQGVGFWNLIYGGIFFFLSFLIRKKSAIALAIAIGLFLSDGILSLFVVTQKMGTLPSGALIARIALLVMMIQGYLAIRVLKKEDSEHDARGNVP